MKKLFIFGLLVFLIGLYLGCSEDHEPLSFNPTQELAKPSAIDTIIFNPITNTIKLIWSQADTTNVTGYHIFMADTTALTDSRFKIEWLTNSTDTTYTISNSYTSPQSGDSTRYYFGVAAMNANGFTGEISDIDSVDVKK